jgi:hypothetical protein
MTYVALLPLLTAGLALLLPATQPAAALKPEEK